MYKYNAAMCVRRMLTRVEASYREGENKKVDKGTEKRAKIKLNRQINNEEEKQGEVTVKEEKRNEEIKKKRKCGTRKQSRRKSPCDKQ